MSRLPASALHPTARRPAVLAAVSAVVMTALIALTGCSGASGAEAGFVSGKVGLTVVPPAEREPAPVATGEGLEGGRVTTDHPGRVVVINVWGSWCEPCRAEAPHLQAAWERTRESAQFVGIDTRDPDPAPPLAFQRTFGITYPSIHDPQGRSLLQFSGSLPPSGIPSTLIVDREGRIAARVIGEVDENTVVSLVTDIAEGR